MFWRFGGYANISAVDTLLDKPDVTLEELLDEPDLIQELKQSNTKLIEYLREDNILKRLLDYVIAPSLVKESEDDEDEDEDAPSQPAAEGEDGQAETKEKGDEEVDFLKETLEPEDLEKAERSRLKYAFVASEVLASETWSILESLMVNQSYLREFWQFIRRKAPLDPLQAGYFTKVNEVLFDRKTEEMLQFFRSLDGVVPAMLLHVDNPMVMDLLLKIISVEKADGGQGIVDWLISQNILSILLAYLSADYSSSTQTSAGDFLKAIITISANAAQNEQSCIGPNSLTRQLVSTSCMETLIDAMLQGGNPLTVGVGIVIEVIRKNNSDYDPETLGGPESSPTNHDPIYLGTLLRLFAKRVPEFMELILSSKHTVYENGMPKIVERGQLNSPWGTKIEPLGFDRFKTCELMAELLHCSNMVLLNEVGGEEYVQQRDAARDKLRGQGAFSQREGDSGNEFNDSTAEFANGISPSALGSGSPDDIRRLEIANATEEDGFEDVASSGVLVDDVKDDFDEKPENEKQKTSGSEGFTSVPLHAPTLGLSDDLVDEPLTPPKSESKPHEQDLVPPSSQPQSTDPVSPTASGLTEKVEDIKIENESQNPPESNEPHDTNTPATVVDTSAALPGQIQTESTPTESGNSPVPLSPHSDDTPAPLFESKKTNPVADMQSSEQAEKEKSPVPSVTDLAAEGVSVPEPVVVDNNQQFGEHVQIDTNGQPVVGDFLKIKFVENQVVPTILGFFFRFPWNNFLHNVVYDVVQQVFNGPMDRGYNRSLATDLFETGRITEEVVEGQRRSDEAQSTKNMRLGYMGHLTLIAEEVVKFSERHPPEMLSPRVMEKVLNQDWIDYVERTLSETRERDNAILGGLRPDMSMGHRQAVLNAVSAAQGYTGSSALANAGLNGGMGNSGMENLDLMNDGGVSTGAFGVGGGNPSLLSSFGSSSDDEDEEMDDMDDENAAKGVSSTFAAESGPDNTQSIPILPPPPAPLNIPPSRARRQLAARLALQKRNAAAETDTPQSKQQQNTDIGDQGNDNDDNDNGHHVGISSREDSQNSIGQGTFTSFPSYQFPLDGEISSSPPFPRSSFTPPGSSSSNSSEDDGGANNETIRRNVRLPLEIDDIGDDDDDDDMGEMVGPSDEPLNIDSDDDFGGGHDDNNNSKSDDGNNNDNNNKSYGKSSGYPNFFAGGFGRRSGIDIDERPSSLHESVADERNDSSDGEDEGLVEILVPGRKTTV